MGKEGGDGGGRRDGEGVDGGVAVAEEEEVAI